MGKWGILTQKGQDSSVFFFKFPTFILYLNLTQYSVTSLHIVDVTELISPGLPLKYISIYNMNLMYSQFKMKDILFFYKIYSVSKNFIS